MVRDGPSLVSVDGGSADSVARPRFWRDALRRRMLAIADLAAAAGASLVVASSSADAFWALALLPVWILFAKLIGLYDRDHGAIRHLTVDELPAIAAWAAAGVAALALVLPLTPAGQLAAERRARSRRRRRRRRVRPARGLARWAWRRITPPELTAVIGDGELAAAIRRKVELFPDMHLSSTAEHEIEAVRRARRSASTA